MKFQLVLLAVLFGATAVLAQNGPPQPGQGGQSAGRPSANKGWQVDLGVGSIVGPEFLGTRDYRILPIPFIDVRYGDRFFLNVPQGLGGYAVNTGRGPGWNYKLGGAIAPGFTGRNADDIAGLEEINIAVEARAYGEISYNNWTLSLTAAQDLGTGHEGFYGDVDLAYGTRVGRKGFARFSGGVRFADQVYVNSFYAITPEQALASGLPEYALDGGLESVAASALYSYRIAPRWSATVIANLRVAVDATRDSPITDVDQAATIITAITYRF